MSSNPIVDCVLSPRKLTNNETDVVRQTLEAMVRDRASGDRAALSNPINIGIGTR